MSTPEKMLQNSDIFSEDMKRIASNPNRKLTRSLPRNRRFPKSCFQSYPKNYKQSPPSHQIEEIFNPTIGEFAQAEISLQLLRGVLEGADAALATSVGPVALAPPFRWSRCVRASRSSRAARAAFTV